MTFHLCYSQNFEDVILQRVFSSVSKGCYVDVGAWHPNQDSVTKLFYDRGWCGINIEPSAKYYRLLQKFRQRDVNLNIAISGELGELNFYEIPGSGLSSLENAAAVLGKSHGFRVNSNKVLANTLTKVFEEYGSDRLVHFLKIDVEGHEYQVVKSLDWSKHRQIVVLVEAVTADKQLPAWQDWEPVLLAADYDFVLFDGLNRFYLRHENAHLKHLFDQPPNIFDGFLLAPGHRLRLSNQSVLRALLQRFLPTWLFNIVLNIKHKLDRIQRGAGA